MAMMVKEVWNKDFVVLIQMGTTTTTIIIFFIIIIIIIML